MSEKLGKEHTQLKSDGQAQAQSPSQSQSPEQRPQQEHDRLPKGLSFLVLAVIVVVILLVLGAALLVDHRANRMQMRVVENPARYGFDDPGQTAQQQRQLQDKRLNSYGWVNREQGIVHIPIDAAMRLWLKQQEQRGQ